MSSPVHVLPPYAAESGQTPPEGTLTYHNERYDFSFQYPRDSVVYSSVDLPRGEAKPPTDTNVCVSAGSTLPGMGDNDDPDVLCVEVFPNTSIRSYTDTHTPVDPEYFWCGTRDDTCAPALYTGTSVLFQK